MTFRHSFVSLPAFGSLEARRLSAVLAVAGLLSASIAACSAAPGQDEADTQAAAIKAQPEDVVAVPPNCTYSAYSEYSQPSAAVISANCTTSTPDAIYIFQQTSSGWQEYFEYTASHAAFAPAGLSATLLGCTYSSTYSPPFATWTKNIAFGQSGCDYKTTTVAIPQCIPYTQAQCSTIGYGGGPAYGPTPNGCGGTVNCGACVRTTTCASAHAVCETVDNCGNPLNCGTCRAGTTCNGDGQCIVSKQPPCKGSSCQ